MTRTQLQKLYALMIGFFFTAAVVIAGTLIMGCGEASPASPAPPATRAPAPTPAPPPPPPEPEPEPEPWTAEGQESDIIPIPDDVRLFTIDAKLLPGYNLSNFFIYCGPTEQGRLMVNEILFASGNIWTGETEINADHVGRPCGELNIRASRIAWTLEQKSSRDE